MAETIGQELEHVVEEVEQAFTPKPGGMIERHRQEKARREAANQERENEAERVEERSYKAVKTALLSPELGIPSAVTIPAGGNAIILPISPYRFRATLNVVSAASPVTTNTLLANTGAGANFSFTLPIAETILAINATYHNASAGTEFPNIQIQDASGNIVAEIPWGTINAATAVSMFAAVGSFAQQSGGTNTAFMPLPALGVLPAGYKVVINAVGGTDTITGISILSIAAASATPTVVLAKDSGAAISSNGYTLTAGNPVVVQNRAILYGFNPTSQPVTVSIFAEIYGAEK